VHFSGGPPATLRGAVSTPARGLFRARIDDRNDVIHYELRYADLTGPITQAHVHFGQRHTVGGIVVWLCQTPGTPAPDAVAALTPFCPGPTEGTVTGTLTPAQVLEVTGQGVAAMEFEELVEAIRAGTTYANVHSATFPPGEIRGQIDSGPGAPALRWRARVALGPQPQLKTARSLPPRKNRTAWARCGS